MTLRAVKTSKPSKCDPKKQMMRCIKNNPSENISFILLHHTKIHKNAS
jgi:hypothetical protein